MGHWQDYWQRVVEERGTPPPPLSICRFPDCDKLVRQNTLFCRRHHDLDQ